MSNENDNGVTVGELDRRLTKHEDWCGTAVKETRDLVGSLNGKMESIHTLVTTLATKIGNGPGKWPSCQVHQDALREIWTTLKGVQKQVWCWAGGISVLTVVGIAFAKKMGLL